MTTPRKRHFKVPDSILREPWDDATLADLMRLQAFLNGRWARDGLTLEAAGEAFLGPQEMMLVTRVTSPRRAAARLLALPDRSDADTLGARRETFRRASGVRISWPKFAEYQYSRPPSRGEDGGEEGPRNAPSATRVPRPASATRDTKSPGDAPASPARCRSCGADHARGKHPIPESPWPEGMRGSLVRWAGGKGFTVEQVKYAVEQVREWADANAKRKACWVAALRSAMTDGWALKNYKPGAAPAESVPCPTCGGGPRAVKRDEDGRRFVQCPCGGEIANRHWLPNVEE